MLRDNLPPLKSPNTDMIAAWLGCGGALLAENNYEDTVEEAPEGTKRQVTWLVDDAVKVTIGGETVGFEEFRKRWLSDAWRRDNPENWISILKSVRDKAVWMKTWIKEQLPWIKITKGQRSVVFHPHLDETRKRKLLAGL
jgi:hypothetical protein